MARATKAMASTVRTDDSPKIIAYMFATTQSLLEMRQMMNYDLHHALPAAASYS